MKKNVLLLVIISMFMLINCSDKLSDVSKSESTKNVDKLISLLKSGNWEVREAAALSLGRLQDKKAIPHLIKALNDEHPNVRSASIESLTILNDEQHDKVIKLKIVKMLDDSSPVVRIYALDAIGDYKIKAAIPKIREISQKDKNSEVQEWAVNVLGRLNNNRTIQKETKPKQKVKEVKNNKKEKKEVVKKVRDTEKKNNSNKTETVNVDKNSEEKETKNKRENTKSDQDKKINPVKEKSKKAENKTNKKPIVKDIKNTDKNNKTINKNKSSEEKKIEKPVVKKSETTTNKTKKEINSKEAEKQPEIKEEENIEVEKVEEETIENADKVTQNSINNVKKNKIEKPLESLRK